MFQDAISVMLEMIRCESEADGQMVTDDDLQVKLLADLQEQQKREAQKLLNDIHDKVITFCNSIQNEVIAFSFIFLHSK